MVLPAIILTFAGGFYSLQTAIGSWILFLITVLMLSLFIGGYYFIARLPVKPLTSDSKINQQINDLFRHHWSVLMVLSALVFAPLTILPTFTIVIDYTVAMALTFCYFILLFVYVGFLYYLFSMRKNKINSFYRLAIIAMGMMINIGGMGFISIQRTPKSWFLIALV